MRIRFAAISLFVCLFASTPLLAQEQQVPFDHQGQVMVVDAEMRETLDLFPGYATFVQAELFRLPDGSYELVIQYREGESTFRAREALDEDSVQDIRDQVSQYVAQTGRVPEGVIDGRRKFLTGTTALGFVHGFLIPVAIAGDAGENFEAGPLIGGALGFGIPFFWSQNRFISDTHATMTIYGGVQGLSHGLLLRALAGGSWNGQAVAGMMSAMSMAQTYGAYTAVDRFDLSAGHAEAISIGSLYGHGFGLGVAALILGEETDMDLQGAIRTVAGSILAGSVGGSLGGYHVADRFGYTAGDTRINSIAGLIGFNAGSVAWQLLDVDATRGIAAINMTATGAGLATGWRLVHNHDFTRSQANMISLGTFAGSLLGSGLVILADGDELAVSTGSLLGSTLGFGVTYMTYAGEASRGVTGDLQMQIDPSTMFQNDAANYGANYPSLRVNYQF